MRNLVESGILGNHTLAKVYADNLTTMYTTNKNGSTTSREITGVVGQLRELCKERNVQISMLLIPGVQNVIADSLSRGVMMTGEWELHSEDWNKICEWISGWLKYALRIENSNNR